MLKSRGIAMSDGLNRKNHFIPLSSIIEAYKQSWRRGTPTNLNHDATKFIGWTFPTGIYIEPGKAYLTNTLYMPEDQDEHDKLLTRNIHYLEQTYYFSKLEDFEHLKKELGGVLSSEAKPALVNGVAFEDKGIVLRVFPELESCLNKGLIDINLLEPVLPGIYKMGKFILFAHRFFRRNCSMLNSLNDSFLQRLEGLRNSDLSVKIALDMDMIGLSGTEHMEVEYQFWWGPKFNEELSSIPNGVTRHENENYDNLFSNLCFTEFGWYIQDGRQTFECEEVTDRPNIRKEEDYYGCRFVHSMLNPDTNLPYHLDGAIRAYTDDKMLIRLDSSIDKSERDTWYTKLWRIDNDMPVSLWKELITHYYRDNMLIGEYFEGEDEKFNKIVLENNAIDKKLPIEKYIPVNLFVKDGIRMYFSYIPCFNIDSNYDVEIKSNEYMIDGNQPMLIMESETITLMKFLDRNGLRVGGPKMERIAHEDLVFNFPIFRCKTVKVAEKVQESILKFCRIWSDEKDDRLISYSIEFNYDDEAIHFSFAGHVCDFCTIFEKVGTCFPKVETFNMWIEKIYEENNKFFIANMVPKISDILTEAGTLRFKRVHVPEKYLQNISMEGNGVVVSFIEKAEKVHELVENKIGVAPVYHIKKTLCMKCKQDYTECKCIKFIDDVTESIQDFKYYGATWTNRHA